MPSKLPKVLNRILKERDMSQKRLSELSGVSPSTISNMLAGRNNYKTDNLIKVSNALEVSLDTLLKDEKAGLGIDSSHTTLTLDGAYRVTLTKLSKGD